MGQWTTFDIAGEGQIDALMQEDFGPDPEPVEDETMAYSVGEGIKNAMDALGDTPASDEIWVGHLGSYADGAKNRYHYNADRNQVYVSFPTAQ